MLPVILRAFPIPVADAAGGLEALRQADRLGQKLAVCGLVAHVQAVLQAEVHRIHADRVGHLVDGLLDGRADLGVAEAAERAGVAVVGVDAVDVDVAGVVAVRAHRVDAGAPGGEGRLRGVRARVERALELARAQRAVAVRAEADAHAHGVALVAGDHALFAAEGHADRFAADQRQLGHLGRGLVDQIVLAAERAAHRRLDDAHQVVRQIQHHGRVAVVDERALVRRVDDHAALARRDGQAALGLDVRVLLRADGVALVELDLARLDLNQRIGLADDQAIQEIRMLAIGPVGADLRRVGIERMVGVEHGGQRLQLQDDRLHAGQRGLGRVGGHRGDGFAHVAHLLVRQHVLVFDRETVQPVIEEIVAGDHGAHAGDRQRGRHVQLHDASVRRLAAQTARMEHPRQLTVGDVLRRSHHLFKRVDATRRFANVLEFCHGGSLLRQAWYVMRA